MLFEFSAPIVVNQAFLDYIYAGHSDMSAWIGTKPDPIANHNTLSDAFLTSLGTREDNNTTSTAISRFAVINAAQTVGNVVVISASADTTTPNDGFKIHQLLSVCQSGTPAPTPTTPTPTLTPTPTPTHTPTPTPSPSSTPTPTPHSPTPTPTPTATHTPTPTPSPSPTPTPTPTPTPSLPRHQHQRQQRLIHQLLLHLHHPLRLQRRPQLLTPQHQHQRRQRLTHQPRLQHQRRLTHQLPLQHRRGHRRRARSLRTRQPSLSPIAELPRPIRPRSMSRGPAVR